MRRTISRTTGEVVMITILTLTTSVPLLAQRSDSAPAPRTHGRTGFMLGVHTVAAPGITITGDDIDGDFATTFGAGAGAIVGYGITRTFTAFVSFDVVKQKTSPDDTPAGSWGLGHLAIGARANLPFGSAATLPYLSASFGQRGLSARATFDDGEQDDVRFSGTSIGLGAGIEHAFSPAMAVDAGVDVGFGKLDQLEVAGEKTSFAVNGTKSMRFRLGVTWRPGARS